MSKNNKLLKIYLEFLYLEIPNIIQVLGAISLFSLIIKDIRFAVILASASSLLFIKYFLTKFLFYLINQQTDPYSNINLLKIEEIKFDDFKIYLAISSVGFFMISLVIIMNIALMSTN